jgi:hypothetical protein
MWDYLRSANPPLVRPWWSRQLRGHSGLALGLTPTHEMAKRLIDKGPPEIYTMFVDLDHLDGSLITALKKEAVFRIPLERRGFFERDKLFGPKVAAAFPSCDRDIRKAGSCYALGQEDGRRWSLRQTIGPTSFVLCRLRRCPPHPGV